jgi:hypothetical protein
MAHHTAPLAVEGGCGQGGRGWFALQQPPTPGRVRAQMSAKKKGGQGVVCTLHLCPLSGAAPREVKRTKRE